jgi:hypothetical protein
MRPRFKAGAQRFDFAAVLAGTRAWVNRGFMASPALARSPGGVRQSIIHTSGLLLRGSCPFARDAMT